MLNDTGALEDGTVPLLDPYGGPQERGRPVLQPGSTVEQNESALSSLFPQGLQERGKYLLFSWFGTRLVP